MFMQSYGVRFASKDVLENTCQYLIADIKKSIDIYDSSVSKGSAGTNSRNRLIIVARGNEKNNEKASKIVLSNLIDYFTNQMPWHNDIQEKNHYDIYGELTKSVEYCDQNLQLFTHKKSVSLVIGYIVWPLLYIVNVGNCKSYLYRNNKLLSLSGETVSEFNPEDSIGGVGQDDYQINFSRHKLFRGDKFLLSSQELTKSIDQLTVASIMKYKKVKDICKNFIKVLRHTEIDNFSLIATKFDKMNEERLPNIHNARARKHKKIKPALCI